ncbi:MAG: ABC transporter permease [Streptococcaceae bacterium]|jgi:putative ABC transport system permease protein|nr:ABC transporter permease [Streptococcaceae bacterium]
MFYLKLASQNIRKSLQNFSPFLLATIVMFAMTFILSNIAFSKSLNQLRGAASVKMMMLAGLVIIIFFSVIIVSYSYRFLLKQRTKEFGLYNILGLNKSQIAMIAFWELVITFIVTLLVGLLSGLILSQFLYLSFVNLIGGNYFVLKVSTSAIWLTMVAFALIFSLLMIFALVTVRRNSAISLLKDSGRSEREPRGRLIISLISLAMIGTAYYLAFSVKGPLEALMKFAFAVVLVIIGTYLLYIGVTIFVLKRQKANKNYYYQPNHFITTSSMLYRMKTNAVGLANITILVTMTFVTLATSVALYVGSQKIIQEQFPQNTSISLFGTDIEKNKQTLMTVAHENRLDLSQFKPFTTFTAMNVFSVDQQHHAKFPSPVVTVNDFATITFVTREDMLKLGTQLPELKDNQVLIFNQLGQRDVQTIDWYGEKLTVKKASVELKNFPYSAAIFDTFVMIVKDDQTLDKLSTLYAKSGDRSGGGQGVTYEGEISYNYITRVMLDLPEDKQAALAKKANGTLTLSTEKETRQEMLAFTGGFLFIGFILGLTFILGAALIIYYKQISEGAEDKRSYRILQEIGLTKKEVKQSIDSQVLIVFFMPIVVSVIHFAVAFLMISKLIKLFGITDINMIAIVSVLTIAAISIIYYLIYRKTSKIYYRIVER